jgi:hypothetical protein
MKRKEVERSNQARIGIVKAGEAESVGEEGKLGKLHTFPRSLQQ